MNDPENIVAAIYRAVDWLNGESNLALLVAVAEGKAHRFVERALLNIVYRKLWNCDQRENCLKKKILTSTVQIFRSGKRAGN
jgi:hypothetical protein